MSPPRYPAIGRRSFSSKPVFRVDAQVNGPGTPWKTLLSTPNREYAKQRLEQLREAGVRVRLHGPGDDE